MMNNYWNYAKEKRRQLGMLAVFLWMLAASGILLLPHVAEQWSHDRGIGTLHLILGLVLGTAGTAGAVWMIKTVCRKRGRDWKRELIRWSVLYLAVQAAAGVIQGGAGALLYRNGFASYEDTKQILYFADGVWQNLFRMFFFFCLTCHLSGRPLKKGIKKAGTTVPAALVLYAAAAALSCLGSGTAAKTVQVLWETVSLILTITICQTIHRRNEDA